MPSSSKRSLIRWRISRATAHCSSGAVLSATRDDDPVGVPALDAPDLRLLDDHVAEVLVLPQVVGDVLEHLLDPVRSSVERDRDVEHGARPVLAHVADPEDLAVADVPDGAVDVAEPGDAQADRLDGAAGLAEVDDVADAVLVLEDHEDAGQEVLDQALRAEAERDADDRRRWRSAARVVAELGDHHDADDREDHDRGDALEQRAHRLGALPPAAGAAPARRWLVPRSPAA